MPGRTHSREFKLALENQILKKALQGAASRSDTR